MKQVFFKIKDGKLALWQSWCSFLANQRMRGWVVKTLKEENVERERFLLLDKEGQWMGIGQMWSDDPKPANREDVLNQMHIAVKKECLEKIAEPFDFDESECETLYDIKI